MLEQLLQVVSNRTEQHRFIGGCSSLGSDPPQPMVVQQAPENGLDRPLPDPAHPLARAAALAVLGTAIGRIKGRAPELLLGSGRRTTPL